jgi:hypothetical protein
VLCRARVETFGKTGVEMEALTAVQVGLLTIYDMCKAVDRGMVMTDVRVLVVFDYQTGRAGAHARAFLASWQGPLMVDDYGGYKAKFANGSTELACMAHVSRKFFDLHATNGSSIAAEALRRIGQLYAIEKQANALTAPSAGQSDIGPQFAGA